MYEISSDFDREDFGFDFKTDHGFEYNVERIFEIYSHRNLLLSKIESSTYENGEITKIPLGKELNKHEELIIKCKFYTSRERIKKRNTFHDKRFVNKYSDKEKADSFIICKLIKKK